MKIKKINLTVESIIWVLFIVIFSYAVLVVGSPINTQPRILYVSINILFIITMFCLFIKKQKIKITKIDLLLLIITISTFLPLIFRTSASLQETVNGIIEYICLFELYICFKALAKDNKRKKQIENLLIVLVMVLIIFGIDMMTYNVLEPVYSILDKVKVFQKATDIKRMVSLFEYANTFGILIAIGYILTLKKAFEDKKSIFVNICLVIQLFAILESKSRFTLFLVLIATIMYFISQRKETELKKQILKIFVLGFISIICDTLYSQFIQNTNNNMTFVVLASTIGITILFTLLYNKIIKDLKINYKYIYFVIFLLIIIIALDIVINTELVIFNKNNTKTQVIRRIENIEPDKLYEFKFLIDAKTKNSFENIYTIYVRLNNKNGEIISREKINFNDYNGEKVVSIKTTIDTEYISLLFNCRNVDQSEYLKIKSLSMNGKEITLDYKILPYKLIERIKNISLDSKSLYERTTMIKDSFKILNKNWIVGQGKDTWKLFYSEIKSYNYYAVQLHCYPMNIWIEYGIIPLCVFIYLVLLVIKRLIFKSKNNKAENIGMLLAILLLVFHSILDFDLDFVNMMCILFIMIGCIQHEDESKFEFSINKILIAILSIISIALIMFNTGDFIAKKMDENNRYSSNVEENFEYYKTRKMLSPLNYSYRVDYTKVLKEYSDTNRQILGDEKYNRIIDEVIYNLEFVFNTEHEIKSDIQKMYQILYECYSEKVTYDKSYKDKLENIQQYI